MPIPTGVVDEGTFSARAIIDSSTKSRSTADSDVIEYFAFFAAEYLSTKKVRLILGKDLVYNTGQENHVLSRSIGLINDEK